MAILDLPEGEHQYKFFVDGQWTHDPSEVVFSSVHCISSLRYVKRRNWLISVPVDGFCLLTIETDEAGERHSDPCR